MSTEPPSAAERFLTMIKPKPRTDRITEDADFLLMLWRMVRALEARTIERPELLPQIVALVQRLAEVPNVAIAINAERFAISPYSGASMKECARAMGITPQSASDRRKLGVQIMEVRLKASNVAIFSEAKREREAIMKAHEFGVVSVAEYQQRRSEYRARHKAA
jgi:hypothetical protein